MKIVKESINFKRGMSDNEIKSLFTDDWIPGKLLILETDYYNSSPRIYFFEGYDNKDLNIVQIGILDTRGVNNYFRFNNFNFNDRWARIDDCVPLSSFKKDKNNYHSLWEETISNVIKDPKNQEYINKIKETFGFIPFV